MTSLVERLRDLSDEDACATFVASPPPRWAICATCGCEEQHHTLNAAAAALEAIEAEVKRWRAHADHRRRLCGFADSHAQGLDGCADEIDAILHPKEPHDLA